MKHIRGVRLLAMGWLLPFANQLICNLLFFHLIIINACALVHYVRIVCVPTYSKAF